MNNWEQDISNNPIQLEIYISSKDTTSGFLEIPQNPAFPKIEFIVLPDVATQISIPTSIAMAEGFGNIESKGIHIQTEGIVSVYAMNKRQWSADISVILPTISLGKNYLVTAHWEDGNRNNGDNSDSEFLIAASADNTIVEIVPSVNAKGGKTAGVPFQVELSRGDVYQVQARGDLTGTQVYAVSENGNCSTFALFAGNRYTKVGECDHVDGHDHLYAQMYPTNTWGLEYITIPFKTRVGGDYFKVMAAEDNTTVHFNEKTYVLERGEHIRETLNNVNIISSDKPINVSQFSRSQACDDSRSDPFTLIVSPKEQLLREVTFYAPPGNNLNAYYLNVLIPKEDVFTITLDEVFISQSFDFVPGDGDFMYAQIPIIEGNHTLKSHTGFNAYVYGYGYNESFGFATGASLENLSLEIIVQDNDGFTLPEDDICWNTAINVIPVTTRFFNQYDWDFGDGFTASTSEPVAQAHTYAEPGTYIIRLTAQRFEAACAIGGQEISLKKITVTRPEISILGPRSVCPNTPEVAYVADGEVGNTYVWDVGGGTINGFSGDSLIVDWGGTTSDAFVHATPTSANGCLGIVKELSVNINIQLEPEAPFGPDSLCSIDKDNVSYFTYQTFGSEYAWDIKGGEILSGNGSSEVEVSWDGPGQGELWFYQTSTTDFVCGGGSDTAQVYVERNPNPGGSIIAPETVIVTQDFELVLDVDTLYKSVNWYVEGESIFDTLEIAPIHYAFDCQGIYTIKADVFDTLGVCMARTIIEKDIQAKLPDLEIVNVTNEPQIDSALHLNWNGNALEHYNKEIKIMRQSNVEDWRPVHVMEEGETSFRDNVVGTSVSVYSYEIVSNEDCKEPLVVPEHNSILLQTTSESHEEASFQWNEYIHWKKGVENYEVWLEIDRQEAIKVSDQQNLEFSFQDTNEGFDYCFIVQAIENEGNNSYSISNKVCASFFPEITTFNVFSPNGDKWNETFEITGIEYYPNSVLTVLNRYGKKVYESTGYQNNWNGGDVAAGVYYWGLELNESRAPMEVINGWVSIMK